MIKRLCKLGGQLFPDRRLLLCGEGRIRSIRLPGWLQASALLAGLAVLGGVADLALDYVHVEKALHHQTSAMSNLVADLASTAGAANDALRRQLNSANERAQTLSERYARTSAQLDDARRQLDAFNRRLAQANGERETLQATLHAAQDRAKSLDAARADLDQRLRAALNTQDETRNAEVERAALRNRLKEREAELLAADVRSNQLKVAVDAMDRKLVQMAYDRDRLRARIGQSASSPAADPPAAVPWPSDPAPGAPTKAQSARESAHSVVAEAASPGGELERLIASTGIDIDRLLGRLSLPPGQGGPYVALSSIKRASPAEEAKRVAELQRLAKMLPLEAPLVHYQLESGFGPRIDPINGRPSFHAGLDLAAPYRTAVLSTAPGIVSFTGGKESYGRVVEVDHGHGIVTRYAHLHRILVAPGQRVKAHQEIGELGSTGRSTGPHVHYEILIDGTPVDPAKFMQAGKTIVQASSK